VSWSEAATELLALVREARARRWHPDVIRRRAQWWEDWAERTKNPNAKKRREQRATRLRELADGLEGGES